MRYLLPDAVSHYIHTHGLYGTGGQRRPRILHPTSEARVDRDAEA